MFMFKTAWKSYCKNNEKNTWKFTKKPGKIMEISWNFVNLEKWEPCNMQATLKLVRQCNCEDLRENFKKTNLENIKQYLAR